MKRLSVIIIGRNEERHIDKCIRSVRKAIESMKESTDIIYVDSASADRSVEIARNHPIRIVQLRPEWELSSAAGRFIGSDLTDSEFIFFIDGDTLVYKSWLPSALRFLKNHPAVAGVAGIVNELFVDGDGRIVGHRWNRYHQVSEEMDSSVFGGIALFRRSVLDDVGGYNPYLTANTDVELCLRIRKSGYKLAKLYTPMALTYAFPRESMVEIIRRYRSDLYALGTTLRYCMKSGLFWQYLMKHLRYVATYMAAAFATIITLSASLITGEQGIFLVWIAAVTAMFVMTAFRRRSIRGIFISLVKRTLVTIRTIQTFITTHPKGPETYPRDVIVIQ